MERRANYWTYNITYCYIVDIEKTKTIEQPDNKPTEPSSGQPPRSNNFVSNSI